MARENGNWTDEEIMDQIKKTAAAGDSVSAAGVDKVSKEKQRRNLLVVGCGDGGSMIASGIRGQIDGTFAICYNTSARNMDGIIADVRIVPEAEDGSGKARDYSKDVIKQGSYKYLLGNIQAALNEHDISYIVVTTTADGGTGSGASPLIAKLISDNVDVPVLIIGVYPSMDDDATAQFNALSWQDEIERTKLPYLIFDNNIENMAKPLIHKAVNRQIVSCLRVIAGDYYGNSSISTIDSRDVYMLLQHVGRRVVIATSSTRPTTTQVLDAYIDKMLATSNQPMPKNVKGIGVFLKGPSEVITKLNTSLRDIRALYGDAATQYMHIEESPELQISVIMSGCSEPEERLYLMKSRYDDIMAAQRDDTSKLSDMLGGITNPLGSVNARKKDRAEPDLSALEF